MTEHTLIRTVADTVSHEVKNERMRAVRWIESALIRADRLTDASVDVRPETAFSFADRNFYGREMGVGVNSVVDGMPVDVEVTLENCYGGSTVLRVKGEDEAARFPEHVLWIDRDGLFGAEDTDADRLMADIVCRAVLTYLKLVRDSLSSTYRF